MLCNTLKILTADKKKAKQNTEGGKNILHSDRKKMKQRTGLEAGPLKTKESVPDSVKTPERLELISPTKGNIQQAIYEPMKYFLQYRAIVDKPTQN